MSVDTYRFTIGLRKGNKTILNATGRSSSKEMAYYVLDSYLKSIRSQMDDVELSEIYRQYKDN